MSKGVRTLLAVAAGSGLAMLSVLEDRFLYLGVMEAIAAAICSALFSQKSR